MVGLKENVILGRLIPAGTGLESIRGTRVADEKMLERQRQAEKNTRVAAQKSASQEQQVEAS